MIEVTGRSCAALAHIKGPRSTEVRDVVFWRPSSCCRAAHQLELCSDDRTAAANVDPYGTYNVMSSTSSSAFPLSKAYFVALFCEAILHGKVSGPCLARLSLIEDATGFFTALAAGAVYLLL